jgi:hypothetical protein
LTRFLPNLTHDSDFIFRIVTNGWLPKLVTFILNDVRDYPGSDFLALATVRRRIMVGMDTTLKDCQFWKDGKAGMRWSQKDWSECPNKPGPVSDFTYGYFGVSTPQIQDRPVFISELTKNVKKMPRGADRGLLTMAVEYVSQNPDMDVKLSELDSLITKAGLTAPTYGVAEDQAACARWTIPADKVPARAFTHEDWKKPGAEKVYKQG